MAAGRCLPSCGVLHVYLLSAVKCAVTWVMLWQPQQQDWQRRNALKRLSIDSQAINTNPFKRASLDQPIDREGSDASAAR